MTDINELRAKRKELRARFFPTQPARLLTPDPLKPPQRIADEPVAKDIKIDPVFEPMEAEEFARKIRRGEFVKSKANIIRLVEKLAIDLHVPFEEIMGQSRVIRVVRARMYVYWYLRRKMKISLKSIGALMGRDHSTVISGILRFEGNGRDRRLKKEPTDG